MTNNYSNWIMTSKFADVEAAAAQSTNKIEWARFETTSQTFTLADLAGFNDLTLQTITIQQQKNVSSVKVTGSTATVTGIFTSTGNPETYYANTILLVGKYNNIEFLAGSTIATGQAMRLPADSPDEYVEFTVRSQISVTSTDTISTTVDPMTSATNERVTAEVEGLKTQIDEAEGAISSLASSTTTGLSGKVGKTGNETIDGVKTFTSAITGSVSSNAGDVLASLTDAAASSELPSTTANTGIKALMQTVRNSLKWLISRFDSSGKAFSASAADSATVATKLANARSIGGVSFDGTTAIDLPGVNKSGNQSTSGNAASATKLATSRKINGTSFDGTTDITVTAIPSNDNNIVHKSGNETIAGTKTFTGAIETSRITAKTQPAIGVQSNALVVETSIPSDSDIPSMRTDLIKLNPKIEGQSGGNMAVGIQSGGTMIVGSGESPTAFLSAMQNGVVPVGSSNGGAEHAYIIGDTNVYIGTGYQNGGITGKWWIFGEDGSITAPSGNKLLEFNEIPRTDVNLAPGITATNVSYKVKNSIVQIRLNSVKGITSTSPTTIATIPTDGRPNVIINKTTLISGFGLAQLILGTNGVLTIKPDSSVSGNPLATQTVSDNFTYII